MRVEAQACVPASCEQAWEAVTEPWRYFADVSRWEPLTDPPVGLGTRWDVRLDIGSAPIGGTVEVVEFDPARDIAWNSVTGVAFRGRVRLRSQSDQQTTVTLRLSYQSPGGLLGLVADRVAAPLVRRTLRRSLDNLCALVQPPD